MIESARPALPHPLVAVLAGRRVPWCEVRLTADEVIDVCSTHDVASLLFCRLQEAGEDGWPADLVARLGAIARTAAATELLRQSELVTTLAELDAAGVRPVLIKGTPLAYTVYEAPSARPRCDTDLVVARRDLDRARDALVGHGYEPTVYCDGELVFRQIELQKVDRFGMAHTLDVHWNVSTQTVFADLLTYDELAAGAVDVPPLGTSARGAGAVHALLLACVHPVMHHRNEQRVLWMYDVHLLACRTRVEQWEILVRLAIERRVAAVVGHTLAAAQRMFRTHVPADVVARLHGATNEPSAEYLAEGRRWHHELVANVTHLPTWRSRARLLREVAFPSVEYMSRSYGVDGPMGAFLLPALYVHRLAAGAGKLLRGKK